MLTELGAEFSAHKGRGDRDEDATEEPELEERQNDVAKVPVPLPGHFCRPSERLLNDAQFPSMQDSD